MNSYMLIQHLACILMLLAIFGNVTCFSFFPFAFKLSRQLGPPGMCHSSVTKILENFFGAGQNRTYVTYIQTRVMCRHCHIYSDTRHVQTLWRRFQVVQHVQREPQGGALCSSTEESMLAVRASHTMRFDGGIMVFLYIASVLIIIMTVTLICFLTEFFSLLQLLTITALSMHVLFTHALLKLL